MHASLYVSLKGGRGNALYFGYGLLHFVRNDGFIIMMERGKKFVFEN